jgi:drug/metabolite transporter (DMT)-like permease
MTDAFPTPSAAEEAYNARQNPMLGMGFMVLQTLLLVAISVLVKFLSTAGHHPIEISFWRSAIMLLPLWFWIQASGKMPLLRTANVKAQILRAALGTLTMLVMFMTYTYLPLAEAQSLFFTTPLFILVLSIPILGERVGPYRTAATLAGFFGMLLMLQPGAISSSTGATLGLLSALGMCGVTLCLRTLGRTQDPVVTIFYFALVGVVMLAPALPFYWKTPTLIEAGMLIGVSLLALANQYFLTRALFIAPPSVTAPVSYVSLLWALLADMWIWQDFPTTLTLLGAFIVIAANIFILYRERVVNARKLKTR